MKTEIEKLQNNAGVRCFALIAQYAEGGRPAKFRVSRYNEPKTCQKYARYDFNGDYLCAEHAGAKALSLLTDTK